MQASGFPEWDKEKAERCSAAQGPLHPFSGRQGLESTWDLWRSSPSCSPGRCGSVWSVWGAAGAGQRYFLQWSPCACSHRCPASCSGEQWRYKGDRRSQCSGQLERSLRRPRYLVQIQYTQESQNLGNLNFCARETFRVPTYAPVWRKAPLVFLFLSLLWEAQNLKMSTHMPMQRVTGTEVALQTLNAELKRTQQRAR